MGRIGKPQKSRKHKKKKRYEETTESSVYRPVEGSDRPPKNTEDQEIPKKLRELMQSIKKAKSGPQSKKNQSTNKAQQKTEKGMTVPVQPVPDFTKEPGERYDQFVERMNRETQDVIARSKLEEKYSMQLLQQKDGKITMQPNEPQASSKKKQKMKQKLKDKIQKKKEKIKEKMTAHLTGFEHLKDEVKFGERVDAPPMVTTAPRKMKLETDKARPGKRALLLKQLMVPSTSQPQKRQIGESVKKRNLSMAQQHILNTERQRVIELYRKQKHRTTL